MSKVYDVATRTWREAVTSWHDSTLAAAARLGACPEYPWTSAACMAAGRGQEDRANRLAAKGYTGTAGHCMHRANLWYDLAHLLREVEGL